LEFPLGAEEIVGVLVESPGPGKSVTVSCRVGAEAGKVPEGITLRGSRVVLTASGREASGVAFDD
jgi:hypothetical protein